MISLITGADTSSLALTVCVPWSLVTPFTVCVATIWSPAFNVTWLASTVQFPLASTFTPTPIGEPSAKLTFTVAPGVPVPVITLSPSVISLITGADTSSLALTVCFPWSLVTPFTVCVATIWSPPFNVTWLASTVQFPLASTFTPTPIGEPSAKLTFTVAPGIPVPVITLSPSVISLITGADTSSLALTVV